MRCVNLCRFPFQEIEDTHPEAVSFGHAVKEKKTEGGSSKANAAGETCDCPQLQMYCSRVSPSAGRETMSFDISHVFFNLMACPVVHADNIYVDHRRTISTTSSPRGLGRLMYKLRKARQSKILGFLLSWLNRSTFHCGRFCAMSDLTEEIVSLKVRNEASHNRWGTWSA
jgi:hypothetical protein